ncbi:toll-like receptor 3 [Littorina saxatilis]|uniref:toll-like receptor 3 n=1 Tax=Littorina saxatilis TaxID=31220 RepID=UPI0038B5CDA7
MVSWQGDSAAVERFDQTYPYTRQRAASRSQDAKQRTADRTQDIKQRTSNRTQDTKQRTADRTRDTKQKTANRSQDIKQRTDDRTQNTKQRIADRTQDTKQRIADRTHGNSSCYKLKHTLCWCQGKTADCSGNYGQLTFVPKLPDGIQFLNFSYNNLTSISSDDFFHNVTQITGLDLGNNGLKTISLGAFRPLSRLVTLLLSKNYNLTYDSLRPVFEVSRLDYLDLRHNKLPPPPADLFLRYRLPRLRILYLHENFFHNINMSVFTPLPSLSYLGLANNGISFLSTDYFPRLSTLHLGQNNLQSFPRTCMENGGPSLFPNLTRMLLLSNRLSRIDGDVCLPNLTALDLQRNHFHTYYTDHFIDTRFPSLEQLDLASMRTKNSGIQRYAFRSKSIQVITLMFNNINFSNVDNDSFAGLPSIRTLQLSHNYFETVSADKFAKMFGNLSTLERMYIGAGRMKQLSVEMLLGLKSLNELQLYQNHLTSLPEGVVDKLVNLQKLNMGSNQISVIKETTFSRATRDRLDRLDLSGNPFVCSCNLRWFQSWLASGPKVLKHPRYKYTCSNLPDTNVTSFYLSEQACLLSRDTNVLMVSCLSLLLVVMTTVFPLYRYRWHLRLMLYEAVRGGGDARRRRLQRGQFQYDVYVSYASDDLGWVRQHLLAELENWGLRLCLHDRDFLIGNNIVDDISQSVESSKKVLVVFSRHYSRNQWCQFELNFCLRHVMDFGDNLVVACVNDVESRDLTTAMMAVMKMMSYIRWDDDPDAMAAFWGRLRQALQEILPADVQQ